MSRGSLSIWRTLAAVLCASAVSLTAAGCGGGGGGGGPSAAGDPIRITSNNLPVTVSGQEVNYCLPFTGGSGGPYILEVISGVLPKGVATDSQTVCLVGRALEAGPFNFRLKLTDTGAVPFSTTTADYVWDIGIGALVFGTNPTLPPYVYNRFDTINLVVAGGVPPYSCEVVDDPFNPNDELLPTGLAIPPDSTAIVGAPTGVKAGQAPFVYKVTIRARDHADDPLYPTPLTVQQEFTITVLIPPVVIGTATVGNGVCGQAYTDKVEVVDGIPPFFHRIASAVNSQTVLAGEPGTVAKPAAGLPGGVAKATGDSAYALDTTAGPYNGKFPEGLFIRETTGDLLGLPRRAGVFNAWVYWVQSSVLPAIPEQNQWKAFSFTMAEGVPPNVALDPAFLLPGNNFTLAGPNYLPSLEIGLNKQIQFLAMNGVPGDGKYDAPHEGQIVPNPNEADGEYNWTGTTFVTGVGEPTLADLGLTFTTTGLLSGTPTQRTGYRQFNLQVTDFQLPKPTSAGHSATGFCKVDIGPDVVIITESTVACDNNSQATYAGYVLPAGSPNNVTYEYNSVDVEAWEPGQSVSTVRKLASTDLATGHSVPTGTALSSLLSGVDLMSTTVNPTWWAYDGYGINTQAARGMQHADMQRPLPGIAYGSDDSYYPYYYMFMGSSTNTMDTYERAAESAIELPKTPTVAHSPGTGVYNNGGQMYAFETATEFGFFVIRRDSKIYVPFCMAKSSGYEGFGDAVCSSDRTVDSCYRRPQISVSPDGRFAAVKMKVDVDNFVETSGSERIVFFSLTGEKPFGGATYRITTTGGSGGTADGQYLYGSSFALTNKHLYFLKGNNHGQSSTNVMFRDHWIYRVEILTGSPALLQPGFSADWTNDASGSATSAMAVPFHRWTAPVATSVTGTYTSQYGPSLTGSLVNTGVTSSSYRSPPEFYAYHWANFGENSSAPMPFRVSADGKACAILAATTANAGTTGTNFRAYDIFVDYDGAGTIRKITSTRRRFGAPTRLAGIRGGENTTKLDGWFTGPATQFEISDDGKNVAAVYNNTTGSWTTNGISNYLLSDSRENLSVIKGNTSSTDPWSTASEVLVTASRFAGSINWRFGSLAWTRDHNAVVFWAGFSGWNPTSTNIIGMNAYPGTPYNGSSTNVYAAINTGSIYQYTLSADKCEGILAYNDGGHTDGVKTYTTSVTNSSYGGNWSGYQGAIHPIGCFLSNDGNFYYMENLIPLNSDPTPLRLVGVNVKHSDPTSTANTINGRAPLRAFAPTWIASRGFGPHATYGYFMVGTFSWCSPRAASRVGTHASVADTKGVVYAISYYNDPTYATNTSSWPSPYYGSTIRTVYYYELGRCAADVLAMDTSTGSVPYKISNLGAQSYSTYRNVVYIQPNRAGTKVAIVSATPNGSFACERSCSNEQVYMVTGVGFTAAGVLTGASQITVESSTGRASSSMAFDFTDTRLYYGWGTGASNENGMSLVEATLNGTQTGIASKRTQLGIGGTTARFAVLNAGR